GWARSACSPAAEPPTDPSQALARSRARRVETRTPARLPPQAKYSWRQRWIWLANELMKKKPFPFVVDPDDKHIRRERTGRNNERALRRVRLRLPCDIEFCRLEHTSF